MTKLIQVNIETKGIDKDEAQEWAHEIANVYADMEVSDVNISGKKISFQAGLSGMDDTTSEDIQQRMEEYVTMTETFPIKNISCR